MNTETRVRRADENICTCGAHPGAACGCDSSRCNGGTPFIGEDGSLWLRITGSLTTEQRNQNRRFAGTWDAPNAR